MRSPVLSATWSLRLRRYSSSATRWLMVCSVAPMPNDNMPATAEAAAKAAVSAVAGRLKSAYPLRTTVPTNAPSTQSRMPTPPNTVSGL